MLGVSESRLRRFRETEQVPHSGDLAGLMDKRYFGGPSIRLGPCPRKE
jgi:hypothetical protein